MLTLLALLACAPDPLPDPPLPPRGECDPVDPSRCALPFPSSFFLSEADSATGLRVDFGEGSLPIDDDDTPLDPAAWNRRDGFSTLSPLLSYPGPLDPEQFPGYADIGASLAPDSLTVIVEVETGALVPHWAELDHSLAEPTRRVLILRPAVPLSHDRTYAVGLRGLVDPDGALLPASPGFATLRDGRAAADPDLERQRQRFEDEVFPALEGAGVTREALQLAWSLHTVSAESALGDMQEMMADATARRGEGGPAYQIDAVEDEDCAGGALIGRTLRGHFTAPLYVDSPQAPARLLRDEAGHPRAEGTTEVEFLVRVPCSLLLDPAPSPILQYGHGVLGNKEEVRSSHLSHLLYDNRWTAIAVSWDGMSDADLMPLLSMITHDVSDFPAVPERSMQGMTQAAGALHLATTGLLGEPALTIDGVTLLDPSRRYFYGNSLGGIYGGAYVAMQPLLDRGVYGVSGAPFSLLLPRSINFADLQTLLALRYRDERDLPLLIALFDAPWEAAQVGGWLPLGGKPALLQVAVGDPQVSTLGAHLIARSIGASTVAPQTRPVWGVEERAPGFTGSALVEWHYQDVADEPVDPVPVDDAHNPHNRVRNEAAARSQLADFLREGVVYQRCDGTCGDPMDHR
ncbi:MAG: hypothetical protein JXX28_01850 [Deltaproteobacteria bacterium]|nr:hypothetical protein [Deltaproteobacteria bacterium]